MKRYFLYSLVLGVVFFAGGNSSSQSSDTKHVEGSKATVKIETTLNELSPNRVAAKPQMAKEISREAQLLAEWNRAESGSEERSAAVQHYISLGSGIVERMMELQLSLPEEEREEFLSLAIESITPEFPTEAARLAETIGTPDALSAVASLWGAQQPAAAAVWALKHADQSPEIIAPLISKWAESDPMAASQWLVTLPAGAARDSGVILLLPQLLESDAEAAAAWIENISDPIAREGMAAQLANAQAVTSADF